MEKYTSIENNALKVLILEDSLQDLEFMVEQLSEAGYRLEVTHAENEAQFIEALEKNIYDMVLSDFSLPGFDAFGALEICQKLCPEVPFICVSGSIGEELAIDLLKKGAVDYVLKDRPERLPFAIKNALSEASEKAVRTKTARELQESENRFKQVAETANEWIWETDINGLYTYASPIVKSLLGYTPEEVVGKKYFYDFFIPEKREGLKFAAFEVFAKRENFNDYEKSLLHKNGQLLIVSTNGSPVFDDNGNFKGYRGVDEDITERKQAEEIKKELLNQLELISFHLPGVIYQFKLRPDGSFHFPYASPGIYNIYGVQPKDVEHDATSAFKAIHPDDLEQVSVSIKHSAQTLTAWHNIYRTNQPSGKTIWVEGNSTPLKLKDGSIIWHGFIQDITEHKISEEALRESETKLKRILNNMQDAYMQADLKGNITFVNPAALTMFRYDSIEEMLGLHASHLYADKKDREFLIERLSNSKKVSDDVLRGLRKDNSTFWASISVQFTLDNEGRINGTEGVIRDISDRKQAEEQLLKLSQAVEQSPASIILTDTKGNVEYANTKTLEITGYTLEEIKGKNPKIFSSGEKPKSEYKNLWETILSGKEWHGEFHNKKKSGELYWELASISPIINEKGEIINFLAVKEDITDRKQILDDLIIAKKHAEESDRLKSAFLANMSHEIRTPMNGILGFAELLKKPGISGGKQQQYIKIIEKSGDRMLNIINDIVDISKIESGLMKIYITETDVNEKIENLLNFFKPEADAKNIQFSVEKTLPKNEAIIKTDSEKVYAVLSNLLKNAIKFTNKGKIQFGVAYESSSTGNKQLKFFVKDTGIGIPKDRQKAIFERFIQADIYDKMALQGAGLGLTISKAYVEMLGGKIWVESEEGIGSKFYFTIPCNMETEEKVFVKDDDALIKTGEKTGKLKILIAEDDEYSEMFLSMIVEPYASEIFIAKNGFEAVEIYKQHPTIDLILMDMKMPHFNGFEATIEIRKLNKKVIIIAQTAFSLSFDRQEVIDAGCNDYVSKPISMNNLKTLIRKYFE